MTRITKKADLKFRTDIELNLLCRGAIRVDEDYCNDSYIIKGKNSLSIKIHDDNIGSQVYSVYCRFDNLNELTGIYNSKHNFHVFAVDGVESAISDFNKFLNQCIKYIN